MRQEKSINPPGRAFSYGEAGEDSPADRPSTVTPLTPERIQAREFLHTFSGQPVDETPPKPDGTEYIWIKADEYFKNWLEENGYHIRESRAFSDWIGYRCHRKGVDYTVYLYAWGRREPERMDGETCKPLLDFEFSRDSVVLAAGLNVRRFRDGDAVRYEVCGYDGQKDFPPELWQPVEVCGRPVLLFYPSRELLELIPRLMVAFNHDSLDAYDCIITDEDPSFQGQKCPGYFGDSGFYHSLLRIHEDYGDMKRGYVSDDHAVFSEAPYIEGYGYFTFRVDNATNRILEITAFPFAGSEAHHVAEFIRTGQREEDTWFRAMPNLAGAEPLPPVDTERFALKLFFDDGTCGKYVFPLPDGCKEDEVVSCRNHVWTERIWQSAAVVSGHAPEQDGYPRRGAGVQFKNGFFLSGALCCQESTPYSEPVPCRKVLYEDSVRRVERLWKWEANSLHEDRETGLIQAIVSGFAFNYKGKSAFASPDGRRLCSIDFDDMDSFHEGLAKVGVIGHGYGFIDPEMRLVIPMIYEHAEPFRNGRAKAVRNGRWLFLDKTGHETVPGVSRDGAAYQDIGEYSEGLCSVSTLRLRFPDLVYYSDYEDCAGIWGFVNEAGEEVIAPQYIFAFEFSDGIACVCKGAWTIDKKWNNSCNTGKYWSEEQLWGAIDPSGHTVIPFIFDDIQPFRDARFRDAKGVWKAHYGGWKTGHWGVIDNCGNWLAEPVFADLGDEYRDGLFAFYTESKWNVGDVPMGIYDLRQNKAIFAPQFHNVSFSLENWILVEAYDEKLGRRVEKLIDRDGREKFPSVYSSIHTWKTPYVVSICDERGKASGLIGEDGEVLLPCAYDVRSWNGIWYEQQVVIFEEGDLCGVRRFDGTVILLPVYLEIHGIENPLWTVRVGDENHYREGLVTRDGAEAVPAEWERIDWCRDQHHILCCREGHCEMLLLAEKDP